MNDELLELMALISEQAPALAIVDGVVYAGHVQSCVDGEFLMVARRLGFSEPRRAYRWRLDEVTEIGRAEAEEPEAEDALMGQARALAEQAARYDAMSLAERLLAERES